MPSVEPYTAPYSGAVTRKFFLFKALVALDQAVIMLLSFFFKLKRKRQEVLVNIAMSNEQLLR